MGRKDFYAQFDNADEFLEFQLLQNHGGRSILMKDELVKILKEHGITLDKIPTKKELLQMVKEFTSVHELAKGRNVGINSYGFQLRFGIKNKDVKLLAKEKMIHVTGYETFTHYGETRRANLYSADDFFNLSKDDVHTFLEHQNKKENRKEN